MPVRVCDNVALFLEEIPLLARLSCTQLHMLARLVQPVRFRSNTVIFQQRTEGDDIFLVREGQVRIVKVRQSCIKVCSTCPLGVCLTPHARTLMESITSSSCGLPCVILLRLNFCLGETMMQEVPVAPGMAAPLNRLCRKVGNVVEGIATLSSPRLKGHDAKSLLLGCPTPRCAVSIVTGFGMQAVQERPMLKL
eukprot:365661-Chlamydomonas_euryale.AAC.13